MPNIQFATPAIKGRTTQWESGQEITFQLEFTGANTTTSSVNLACDGFAQNPAIATIPASKSTKTRKIEVKATINADPGTHTVTLVGAMGGTVTGTTTATFTVITRVSVQFKDPLVDSDVKPPYEAGDLVEICLEATGPNTSPASIEIFSDAFARNPVIVKIPAAGRIGSGRARTVKATPVALKGSAGVYNVELRENVNCSLGATSVATITLVDPVQVSFANPGFKDGVLGLKPEDSVKLCLKIDRAPKVELSVTIRCPGFGKSSIKKESLNPFSFKIKKGHDPAKPLEESINLTKEEGKYTAVIAYPNRYGIGSNGEFDFEIGPKRVEAWLPNQPFDGAISDAVAQGETHTVKIEFSEALKNEVTLTLKCPGFEPATHEFKVKKGTASPYLVPQKFKLIGDAGIHRIELLATDTILKNPVDVRPSNAAATFKLPWPPGIPTIEFADPAFGAPLNGAKTFAPGESVRFLLQLDRAVTAQSIAMLVSDAFPLVTVGNRSVRFAHIKIPKGVQPDNPPVIEVALRDDIDFANAPTQKFTVELHAKATVLTVGAAKETEIEIRNFAVAIFSAKLPVKPASTDGYDAGTQVTLRLELSEPAVRGGASAAIKSPLFSTSGSEPEGELAVEWEEGRTIAMVNARLMTSQIDVILGGDYDVELIGPTKRCSLSSDPAKIKTTINIRPMPVVTFLDAWIKPDTGPYRVGQYVTFAFGLDRPAPAVGAQFLLTSTLFNDPVKCEFVAGEQILKVRVMLENPSPTGTVADVEITAPDPFVGCRLSTDPNDLKGSIEVLPSPQVKFTADWITPSGVTEYAEGTDVQITVELDAPAPEDAYARISSSAFGGKSYVVQFPKGSTSQSAIVQTGKEDHPEKLLKPLLTSRMGRRAIRMVGGGMALDKPLKALEKAVTANLKVGYADRVTKATKPQDIRVGPIRGCGGSDIRTVYVKPNLKKKIDDPIAPCPYGAPPVDPPKHCNMHRLLVQEFHGSNPAARGHDGGGTFEVVASDAAPKIHRGAVVSPMRIQMIAGKVLYSVDDKPIHNTNIKILADRKDYYCTDSFPHLDRKEGGRLHPHVTVLQKKPYRLEALLAGGGSIAAQNRLEALELPEYPGWVAVNPEVGGVTARIMKWAKLKPQEPTAPNALLGKPLWELKVAKRRQGFDKMLTKGVAKLIGKDELIFSDDDEALAEATKIGVDTSDLIGGISLGDLIRSIMTIWVPRIEQYQVILESCGDPDPAKPTPKIPAPRLVAMIEVYPSDEFCLFCNVTPVPAMQFGNDGQYMDINGIKDNAAANNTNVGDSMPGITNLPTTIDNALQPISDLGVGPISGNLVTDPITGFVSGVTSIGSQAPSENYKSDEISGTRNTVGQFGQSHGGGQVHETPEFGGPPPDQYQTKFAELSLKPDFTYLTTGVDKFELRRKDPQATTPRYPAPTPNTRVFHQVYEFDLFGAQGATGELTRDWNIAKIGMVVNGNTKPQFSPITVAIFGLIYVIRHWSDIWRAIQEMVPSWGWGITFDLGFLEGGFRMRWGWKEYEDWTVFRWWQFEIDCNLFRLMIELWVGFRARALFIKFEFVAFIRIVGILNCKASIERTGPRPDDVEGEFQLTDHKNDKKIASWNADLSASTTAEVGLRMVLFNDGCLKATGSIKTGYLLKFKFKEPIEGKVGLTLEGYFLGVSVKLIIQSVGLKKFIQKEKVLIEGDPDGRPRFRRILFPKGAYGQKTPWKVKDQLELIWQKVSAQVARLDEATNDWYKIQLDLVLRRDKEEFERLAATNPRAEWPWTDDPGVSIQLTPTGYAMKTTEDAMWKQQWVLCKESLVANRVVAVWDLFGTGKPTKYKKSYIIALPKIGPKIPKKMKPSKNLAADIVKASEKAEIGIEKVKNAIATINVKFVSTLQHIDRELERFADEDLKVSEEILEKIEEAKEWASWGLKDERVGWDTRGTVRGIVEDALEDFDIEKLAKLVYQVDKWTVGGETIQPKTFLTVDKTNITNNPTGITLWIDGASTTIDITGKNNLIGLRNAINAAELNVIATIESLGKSFYLALSPELSDMGNLGVTDGNGGPLIAGRK